MCSSSPLRALLLLLAALLPSAAQSVSGLGAVSGVVTDVSRASVANAVEVVSNDRLGIHREMRTTTGGVFNALSLTRR